MALQSAVIWISSASDGPFRQTLLKIGRLREVFTAETRCELVTDRTVRQSRYQAKALAGWYWHSPSKLAGCRARWMRRHPAVRPQQSTGRNGKGSSDSLSRSQSGPNGLEWLAVPFNSADQNAPAGAASGRSLPEQNTRRRTRRSE